ncbi:hypothetical protein BKA63DRAFT_494856 [Paraphoma chrysanthemicola]|nr:hypothetical protein BKA63DRAFT_494856 [Paraphoma chrysanthemicola]
MPADDRSPCSAAAQILFPPSKSYPSHPDLAHYETINAVPKEPPSPWANPPCAPQLSAQSIISISDVWTLKTVHVGVYFAATQDIVVSYVVVHGAVEALRKRGSVKPRASTASDVLAGGHQRRTWHNETQGTKKGLYFCDNGICGYEIHDNRRYFHIEMSLQRTSNKRRLAQQRRHRSIDNGNDEPLGSCSRPLTRLDLPEDQQRDFQDRRRYSDCGAHSAPRRKRQTTLLACLIKRACAAPKRTMRLMTCYTTTDCGTPPTSSKTFHAGRTRGVADRRAKVSGRLVVSLNYPASILAV